MGQSVLSTPHVPDSRIANKAEVAEFFNVSITAVHSWVRRGCPVIQKGGRGVSWKLDLYEVAAWYFGRSTTQGGNDGEISPDNLPPAERKAWFESEKKRRELQILDRELIPVAEVERTVATAFAAISSDIRALPDNLERRFGVPPDIVARVEEGLYAGMEALAENLASLAPVGTDDGIKAEDT